MMPIMTEHFVFYEEMKWVLAAEGALYNTRNNEMMTKALHQTKE